MSLQCPFGTDCTVPSICLTAAQFAGSTQVGLAGKVLANGNGYTCLLIAHAVSLPVWL